MRADIQTKLRELKAREQAVSVREQVAATIQPLYQAVQQATQETVTSNYLLLLQSVVSGLGTDIQPVITALEKQTEQLEDTTGSDILGVLRTMVARLQAIQKNVVFDQKEFNSVFTEGIGQISTIIVRANELPLDTSYQRTLIQGRKKITRVVETYEDTVITYNWHYDSDGELRRIVTSSDAK